MSPQSMVSLLDEDANLREAVIDHLVTSYTSELLTPFRLDMNGHDDIALVSLISEKEWQE